MKLKGVGAGKWGILKKGYRLNNLHAKIANDDTTINMIKPQQMMPNVFGHIMGK